MRRGRASSRLQPRQSQDEAARFRPQQRRLLSLGVGAGEGERAHRGCRQGGCSSAAWELLPGTHETIVCCLSEIQMQPALLLLAKPGIPTPVTSFKVTLMPLPTLRTEMAPQKEARC